MPPHLARGKDVWKKEIQKGPELVKVVLEWCACDQHPARAGKGKLV
jgi:hypothetical protein